MGRYLESSCKICRRNKEKLYLKGARCESAKCALEKRNFPPGPKTSMVKKMSEYGRRLREKQKLRFFYGVSELQMRNYFKKALAQKGVTGYNLLALFERRLDNVLFRTHLARSRKEARQLIRHRHFFVNGRLVDIPSFLLEEGDVVHFPPNASAQFTDRLKILKEKGLPTWLSYEEVDKKVRMIHLPKREEIGSPVQERLIVEFYSM